MIVRRKWMWFDVMLHRIANRRQYIVNDSAIQNRKPATERRGSIAFGYPR